MVWTFPTARIPGFDANEAAELFEQISAAPFSLLGAIFVIQAGAVPGAALVTRMVGPLRNGAPAIRLAIAFALGNRLRAGTVMFLFATVILSVTVMSYVVKATQSAVAPQQELTANFDIKLTTTLLSLFDPIHDLGEEARQSSGISVGRG